MQVTPATTEAEVLTVDDVASRLQVSRRRVYDLLRLRWLPVVHVGRQLRVPSEAVRQFIAGGGYPLGGSGGGGATDGARAAHAG